MIYRAKLINPIRIQLGWIETIEGYRTEHGIRVTSNFIEGTIVPWTNIAYYKER
jgi:hypothetical protein